MAGILCERQVAIYYDRGKGLWGVSIGYPSVKLRGVQDIDKRVYAVPGDDFDEFLKEFMNFRERNNRERACPTYENYGRVFPDPRIISEKIERSYLSSI